MNQPIMENGQLFVLVLCSALRTKEAHTSALPINRPELGYCRRVLTSRKFSLGEKSSSLSL